MRKRRRSTPATSGGVLLTEEVLDRLVAEAEAGYPLETLRARPLSDLEQLYAWLEEDDA